MADAQPSVAVGDDEAIDHSVTGRDDEPYTCQGCGAVRYGSRWRDRGHACWRNEDGSYEEGGTFQ